MSDENFFDMNIGDAVEPELVDAGDYELRILSAEHYTSEKTGSRSLHVVFGVENSGKINPAPVHVYLGLPTGNDVKEVANNKLLRIKRFCACFGVQVTSISELLNLAESQGLNGLIGECRLTKKSDPEYGDKNEITRWNAKAF
jgi:hypothetical protein